MENIFDNGESLLGKVEYIKEYIFSNCDDLEEIKEIIEDLEDYNSEDIVFIDYDRPFGYSIDRFSNDDKIDF